MIIGQIIQRFSGAPYYSPQFPRGGGAATFLIEVFMLSAGVTFTVTVEHKNIEDTSWTLLGSFAPITTIGVAPPLNVSGIKEELRYTYVVGGAAPTDAVYFNVPGPSWRPY